MIASKNPLRDSQEILPGDIIGFSGEGWMSTGIILATYGLPYMSLSHVGIMGEHDGRLLLFESTTLTAEPCEITGKHNSGTQAHSLDYKLASYRGKMWHYPLYRALYEHESKRLTAFLESTLDLPYDTIGAIRAGGETFSWIESRLRKQDLHSLFCSEWCAAAHSTIGLFPTDNVSRWNPNRLTRTERYEGILQTPRRIK